jgi:predicted RNA-binding Zn ribbon-like protein
MPIAVIKRPDPVFVGDHLAMDFLNSVENPSDNSTDWMSDGRGLVGWLQRAKAIDASVAARILKNTEQKALDAVAGDARKLREWFREFPTEPDSCRKAPRRAGGITLLNRILAQDDSYGKVVELEQTNGANRHAQFRRLNRWETPNQLLQPIAEAIARLICEEDLGLVRTCAGPTCTLMFLDKTRRRGRRWCSMAVCGNRAKAAAHRAKSHDA